MNVLVVEDDAAQRLILKRILELDGHAVVAAADGREGLEQFEKERFDCVVTDWTMPYMDGIELCRRIRAIPRDHHVHVIMATGNDTRRDVIAAFDAGADDFIRKPVEPEETRARLRSAERAQRIFETITRRQAEQIALKKSLESRDAVYRDLFARSPDPMQSLDGEWRICEVNQAWTRAFGYSSEEVAGHAFEEFVCDDAWRSFEEFSRSLERTGLASECALRIKDKSGEPREIFASGTRTVGSVDAPTRLVIRLRDVTESRRQEHALLERERLASVGTLASGVASEISDPISNIHSSVGALEKYTSRLVEMLDGYATAAQQFDHGDLTLARQLAAAAAQQRKSLKIDFICTDVANVLGRIRDHSERVKRIVSDIRTMTRPNEGITDADVHEVIRSAINIVGNSIKGKAEIVRDLQPVPKVHGNAARLTQVIANLLVNAGESIKENGNIKVSAREVDHRVVVSVTDDGSGIPEPNLRKIFEPFFTTKPPGQGAGMGLNICFKIVQEHHGSIHVESTIGQGTTFRVDLPAAVPTDPVTAPGDAEPVACRTT